MTPADSLTLRQRLHKASVRAAHLDGTRTAETSSQSRWAQDVALAKGRLGLADEVSRIFDALQQRAHERSVGAFERLLTAILQDVLPEEGAVRLLTEYKNNTTWLDVALEKEGSLEDVFAGNGGAVTNVVCAGLRFAALSRTQNRRLMVLDEPDCWLKPDRVPAFVRVIAQVAKQTNTQTFFITHHDPAFFEDQVNVVRFSANDDNVVQARAEAPRVWDWEDDEAPGVRGIELINFRRHSHTVIPCFPGATAFIGDNNLGKSTAIVSSFTAVAYGESDDSMLRHGCNEARIIFHLEGGRRLEWSRSTKRSPSVLYQLFERGEAMPSQEGRPKTRNQAPEWVQDVLGIARVDDLDIQIGNQKKPVFLLNDPAPRRAQILSIGRESSHLKSLMKCYEEMRGTDRDTVKQGELQLARLKFRLDRLIKLTPTNETLAELAIESEDILVALELREKLSAHLGLLEKRLVALQYAEREAAVLRDLPVQPELLDTVVLARLCEMMPAAAARSGLSGPALPGLPELSDTAMLANLCAVIDRAAPRALLGIPSLPAIPELTDVATVALSGQRIAQAAKRVAVLQALPPELPAPPPSVAQDGLDALMARLAAHTERVIALITEDMETVTALGSQQKAFNETVAQMGGLCPLCGSTFSDDNVTLTSEHKHVH